MNTKRSIGLFLLAIGVLIYFTIEKDIIDFISGFLIGASIMLLATKTSKPKIK